MPQDIRICFIGDSLVNGAGDSTALGWAGRLCASANAGGASVTYYNLGIRGNTSKDILLRWKNECTLRLPDSCDGRVVISCGVNDTVVVNGTLRMSPEESCANIREILRGAIIYKVLMVGPPPVEDNDQNKRINALSQSFAREAALLNVPYIDLFSALVVDERYKRDVSSNEVCHPKGFHPTSKGYSKIAEIVSSSPSWWFHAP